ncbi:RMD1 family protein [Flaviaesturariibacter flavus]|uniref:RMD1 family protein n=1 Tax=Flaviaesturariibacter flavus TaxID=2502780 RepID=A0A4V2NVJ4_9BACT|nr:RMD1 family protein [Flaviaesturariibacter flavus]TCJ13732.1 RMD1 family protein [Flaviaesturariibacter flavus]
MILKVQAYQVSDSIDIRAFRAAATAELYYSDADELFYRLDPQRYLYVFKYGVLCFLNCDAATIGDILQRVRAGAKNPLEDPLIDDFIVETDATENRISYHKIEVKRTDVEVLRLVMLNVSQSVALDYFSEHAERLLTETNRHTRHLEHHGRLSITGRKLQRYIARTLMLRNNITENLYIFDSPPETWEDEELNRVDAGMKRNFDLQERFRYIAESLQIVKDNLDLFRDIMKYRHSNTLEWIVIILIAIEVLPFIWLLFSGKAH